METNSRVVAFRVPPDKVEELAEAYQRTFIPEAKEHPGFLSLLLLWDPEKGEALDITLWEGADARRESERQGGLLERKISALSGMLEEAPSVENYNLLLIS